GGQQSGRLVLGEVVAPRPERRDRDSAPDAEEGHAGEGDGRPVQDAGGGPARAGGGEFVGRFVVPGDEDRRPVGGAEDVEAGGEVLADVAEVAGPDEDIDAPRAADQRPRRGGVTV